MKLNLSTYLFKKIQRQEQHTFIEIDTLICKFYTFIDLVYPSSVALVCRVTSPFTWSSERLKPEWEKEKIRVVGNRGLAQAIARAIFNGKYDKREVFMIRKMDLAWEISCIAVFFYSCRKMWGIPSFTLHTRSFSKISRYMGNAMFFPSKIDFLLNCLNLSMFWSHIFVSIFRLRRSDFYL